MNLKPFDLEAAKRGDLVIHKIAGSRGKYMDKNPFADEFVFAFENGVCSYSVKRATEYLRMAPKRRETWVAVWRRHPTGEIFVSSTKFETKDGADKFSKEAGLFQLPSVLIHSEEC